MSGLIKGFPNAIMFVDGTLQLVFENTDDDVQNDQYFGKDRMYCYVVFMYVGVYGMIRGVEVLYSGRLDDKICSR